MNRLQLVATVVECQPLRYTPAGVPVLDLVLEHAGDVVEAGQTRHVELTLPTIAIGDLARMMARTPLGTALRIDGFLAPTRKGATRLRLHLQQAATLD